MTWRAYNDASAKTSSSCVAMDEVVLATLKAQGCTTRKLDLVDAVHSATGVSIEELYNNLDSVLDHLKRHKKVTTPGFGMWVAL